MYSLILFSLYKINLFKNKNRGIKNMFPEKYLVSKNKFIVKKGRVTKVKLVTKIEEV